MQLPSSLRSGRGLAGFAILVITVMIAVILWGAVVRATGSGNGCGDHWPLCNGEWVPAHPRVATIIEFVHRQTSAVCTSLVAALIAWTFAARPKGSLARRAAVWTGVLLLVEAVLGAVLVLGHFTERDTRDLRVLVQGVHLSNTMLLLAAMTLAWWWQRPRESTAVWTPGLRGTARWAMALSILTAATGSVAALADTLFPSKSFAAALQSDVSAGAPLLIRMRFVHPLSAFIAAALTLWVASRLVPRARNILLSLVAAQILLGTADVILLAPIWLQMLHLLFADLYWIALVALCSESIPGAHRAAVLHITRIDARRQVA